MKKNRFDRWFAAVSTFLLALLLLAAAYPLYFVVIASLSNPSLVSTGQVFLYPREITLTGYQKVLEYRALWAGYANTVFYTVAYTAIATVVTLMAGFALAKRNLVGQKVIMAFMTLTMLFSGGLIPMYLLIRSLHMKDTVWPVILLGSVNVYNIIITRTFFRSSIPGELYEAASLDGCNQTRFFLYVALPISPAIIAVLVIFSAVSQWNSWFNAMLYLNAPSMMPLQMVLRDIIISQQTFMSEMNFGMLGEDVANQAMLAETMKYAVILVSALPILCVYPFAQKYFVKGIMIGSIKG